MQGAINLLSVKKDCLRQILSLYKKANAGHIGTSLSCLDLLIFLHFRLMNETDKFILSKGHAALALYVVLAKSGYINEELLETFYSNGTSLAAHPPCSRKLNGIHFGTGSLGHGLSLATGFALSGKLKKSNDKVYCILSEGDCDEGSTWEAALFAAHHKLNNLTIFIDNNGLQGFGASNDVLNLEPLKQKWESFNFEVEIAEDGNNIECIEGSFKKLNQSTLVKPRCIIAKTTKGNGVSYMENKMEWHYLPMNDEQFIQALEEINNL